eukprot:GHVR01076619.1.p1 GENE.GHVR01076619.1~~GHVR01076619.1.p1  ORF type:complete len:117 (-),score=6.80 GHVR01076619.1:319-669(-)
MFVCVYQIVSCLGLCSSIFDCLTQIVGFVACGAIGIGIIMFGLLPSLWDKAQGAFPKIDLPVDLPPDLPPVDLPELLPTNYSYQQGSLLYLSSFALLAVFVATMFVCCCKCFCKKV